MLTKRANEGNSLIQRLAETPGMRFIPCISLLQRERDLSARISWLLNYILVHPRPMEVSITLVQDIILSPEKPFLGRLFPESSVDKTSC